jgi:hypothetical protein
MRWVLLTLVTIVAIWLVAIAILVALGAAPPLVIANEATSGMYGSAG